MASAGTGEFPQNRLDTPSWRLQGKTRLQTAESSLSRGGFAAWTDVPPIGVRDVQTADQDRGGMRHYPHLPGRGKEADPLGGGKACPRPPVGRDRPEGKRAFSREERPGAQLTPAEMRPGGLKRVNPPAPPATSNPNYHPDGPKIRLKPEGVKITGGDRNNVNYQCWRPENLNKAYGGDWNLNTRYGLRKLNLQADGVPTRMKEEPIAWPSYAGYPPDCYPSGRRIDYSLKKNGGIFQEKPPQHPDVIKSHQMRLAAGKPPPSYSAYRHAGDWYY